MPENKTKQTSRSVEAFLHKVTPASKREDSIALVKLMKKITRKPPKMWGPSMVGFGSYDYSYESGHSGTIFGVGFSPRKAAMTIYFLSNLKDIKTELRHLGKHKSGKGCLYVKTLSDIDMDVLATLIRKSFVATTSRSLEGAKAL